jgi:hypothetical protein
MVLTGLVIVLTIYILMVWIGHAYGVNCLHMVPTICLWCKLDLHMVLPIYLWCLLSTYDGCYVFIVIKVFTRYSLMMLKFVDVVHYMFTTRSLYAYIVWYMLFVLVKCL